MAPRLTWVRLISWARMDVFLSLERIISPIWNGLFERITSKLYDDLSLEFTTVYLSLSFWNGLSRTNYLPLFARFIPFPHGLLPLKLLISLSFLQPNS
jgi:hypothetical protein